MRLRYLAAVGGLIAALAAHASEPQYTITDLGPSDGYASGAFALNNKGQIAGATDGNGWIREPDGALTHLDPLPGFNGTVPAAISDNGTVAGRLGLTRGSVCFGATSPREHGFLYHNGKMTDTGILPGPSRPEGWPERRAWATGVNDAGVVVGTADSPDGPVRPFVWHGGAMREVSGHAGNATAISESGAVLGVVSPPSSERRPFLWKDGEMTFLPTLDAGPAKPSAIPGALNADDVIVGSSMSADGKMHACLWKDGRVTDLGGLMDGVTSAATDINDAGVVVGTSGIPPSLAPPKGTMHAVRWTDGKISDLNSLLPAGSGWELTAAIAINNDGAILGRGRKDDMFRSFLLRPAAPNGSAHRG